MTFDDWQAADAEDKRLLALSPEEVMAEHLALYGGDQKLADRSIAMMRASLSGILARHWKQ